MKHLLFSGLLPILLGLSFTASAQLEQTETIVITTTSLDKEANLSTTKTYIDKDKVLTETSAGKQETFILFDAEEEILYLIDHKRQEVTEMTREDMTALSAMLEEQMSALNKQFEKLPEEQRKIMKERMGTAMGTQQEPTEYALEKSDVAVKSWKTNKYIGTANGNKKSEIYIASYAETGLEAEDFAAMEKFYTLMKDFAGTLSRSTSANAIPYLSESMPGYKKGIPVKSVLYNSDGEAIHTLMVEEIGEEVVEDTIFDIPGNYKRKKMEGLAGKN